MRFNPDVISYEDVLQLFVSFHCPAERAYTGTQYRSAIFYHTAEQQEAALRWRKSQSAMVQEFVSVEAAGKFYRAEEYHQKYHAKAIGSIE